MAAATAALLAWLIASFVFGHSHPVFAAISAIVCLSPGLPSKGKQAIGLLVGVATGIVIGEVALFLPDSFLLIKIGFATFFAIAIAALYGLAAVVPIQAGVSAVLVLAVGPESAGTVRMIDVAVGASVGLIFSQILFTPNPVQLIDDAAKQLLDKLLSGFQKAINALDPLDVRKAQAALQEFSRAHDCLVALDAGITSARSSARWSVRGRFVSTKIDQIASRYDRHSIRLYASALLFAEAFANAIRKDVGPPPDSLRERLEDVVLQCSCLSKGAPIPVQRPTKDTVLIPLTSPWRTCLDHLTTVEDALNAFGSTTQY